VSRAELIELARQQGLSATAQLIERFHMPELFSGSVPADARLFAPPHHDPLDVLGQMVRRGFHPVLLRPLLNWLAKRPLERALFAWDALAMSVIQDGELLGELRAASSPHKNVLPQPGRVCIDLNAHPATKLILGRTPDAHVLQLLSEASDHSLAALAELGERGDSLPQKPGAQASIRALGRLLHLAHAPTLAALNLDYLSRGLGFRLAARDLCEAMLDVGAAERIPADALRADDLPPELISDHAEYLTYRSYLPMVDTLELYQLMQRNLQNRPRTLPQPSMQLHVVQAHVCALVRRPGPLTVIDLERICDENKSWRYAARVRAVVTAQVSPPRSLAPLTSLHAYLSAFGHDLHTAYECLLVGPAEAGWKQQLLPLFLREALALPHEVGVWRALIIMIGDERSVVEPLSELQRRVEEQSRL
jgi:hypothetical protein